MANEAVLVVETELPTNYDCADGTGIEKGAICKNANAMTASLADGNNDIIAGIVQSEKIASDGITSVSIFRGGKFRVYISGSVSAGDPVIVAGTAGFDNYVMVAATNSENILGYMVEDGTAGQQKIMELRPTTMQLA